MAVTGYNFFIDGVKVTDFPSASPVFTYTGLASNTDYTLEATAVDAAGNESPLSTALVASTSAIPVPVEGPLSAEDAAAVDALINAFKTADQPSIMVSLTGPKGYYTKVVGVANTSTKVPQNLDNHVRIGSITKTFTARAILLQLDAGLLSLSDKLSKYVTGVTNGETITIEQLLMHTSGVHEYTADLGVLMKIGLSPTSEFSEAAALDVIKGKPAQFAPGAKYQYTNSNYILLAAVLRAITGQPAREVITEQILVPLGLTQTSWPTTVKLPTPYSDGYSPPLILIFGGGQMTDFNPELAGGAGAMVSTIGDLVKWGKELRDGTQLSAETQDIWLETLLPHPSTLEGPLEVGYGLGVLSMGSWLGHDGSINGFTAVVMFNVTNGAVIAISRNWNGAPNLDNLFVRIANYLYPGSMTVRDYSPAVKVRTRKGTLSLTAGTPRVLVESPDKLIQPQGAALSVVGGQPAGLEIKPPGATLTLTGSAPGVTVFEPFIAFSEENSNRINRTVPGGCSGCYVTLIGGGGGGGRGRHVYNDNPYGGGGGGGGAIIKRTFIPAANLGPTYSVTRGLAGAGGPQALDQNTNGAPGGDGGASTFTSGAISWSAGGGGGGAGGTMSSGTGGTAGTVSASGFTPAGSANGTAGGSSSTAATAGAGGDNASGGPAGGGGGGGFIIGAPRNGGRGGNVTGISTGGAGATDQLGQPGADGPAAVAGVPGSGGGGGLGSTLATSACAGGNGIGYGAGGGGGGGKSNTTTDNHGGNGGSGYTLIEWT